MSEISELLEELRRQHGPAWLDEVVFGFETNDPSRLLICRREDDWSASFKVDIEASYQLIESMTGPVGERMASTFRGSCVGGEEGEKLAQLAELLTEMAANRGIKHTPREDLLARARAVLDE